jgi:anti-sigma factor RsiW
LLTDYLDDDLDPGGHRRVERHVRFCPRCRRVLSNLRATIDRLAHLGAPAVSDPGVGDDVVARIQRSWREPRG